MRKGYVLLSLIGIIFLIGLVWLFNVGGTASGVLGGANPLVVCSTGTVSGRIGVLGFWAYYDSATDGTRS